MIKILNKKIVLEILLIAMIILVISPNILLKPLGDMDEVWNYNFGNNISNGQIPYKEFSMLQTPFTAFFSGIVLALTSNSLLTMRILAIILSVAILFLIYKILEKLKINKSISICTIIAMTLLSNKFLRFDYNFFVAFFVLLIIYLEISLNQNKLSSNIIIGIVAGLAFITKQTIGAFACMGIVLYHLAFEIYKAKKNNEKIQIKNILYRILGATIPILLFALYLLITGSLGDFIDYTILGISTFSNTIKYTNLFKNDLFLLALYIPINFIIMLIYSVRKKDRKLFIIFIMSIIMFIIAFPISDDIHFMIGIIPSCIGISYLLDKMFRKIYTKKLEFLKYFMEALSLLLVIFFIGKGTYGLIKEYGEEKYFCKLKHFENIPTTIETEQGIKEIQEYIQSCNKNVYILNFDAALYMIPLDRYNKDYDMLMNGNFGGKGAKGLIERIKSEKDAVYLILSKDKPKNWQHPGEVTDYIEKNLTHKGSIEKFEIYENIE